MPKGDPLKEMDTYSLKPVDVSFFQYPTLELAQSLLGMLLVKEAERGTASGWIVETEAYIEPNDRAAHSYGNRWIARTGVIMAVS